MGENIAAGAQSAAGLLEQLKHSDSQCKMMMSAEYNRFAEAIAFNAGSTFKFYWTQMFATDHGAVDTSCSSSLAPGTGGGSGGSGSGGVSVCEDTDHACSSYDSSFCRAPSEFAPYMEEHCKSFCGFAAELRLL